MSAYRKKLIEVALPLDKINAASGDEKKIHVGTPSNLHAWWARRPLAACRAVLFASLVDDPGNHLDKRAAGRERKKLFQLIHELVQWDAKTNEGVLSRARAAIEASVGADKPIVVDPFSGSGSIPIEALRLGLDAIGIDLNPIAVLLGKALVEVPPSVVGHEAVSPEDASRSAKLLTVGFQNFEKDLLYFADRILDIARGKCEPLYEDTYGGASQPIAWLWCRTARCENPACEIRLPLVSSLWLSKRKGSRAWLEPNKPDSSGRVNFTVVARKDGEAPPGTITSTGAVCPSCDTAITFSRIREQGRNGVLGFQLNAYVTKDGSRMVFHGAQPDHETRALQVKPMSYPETDLPEAALGFRVQKYGLTSHHQLFMPRQLAMLDHFADALQSVASEIRTICGADKSYGDALITYLAVFFDRMVQTNNALVRWFTHTKTTSKAQPTFDKQTVNMVWDFAEANPLATSTGGWRTCCKYPMTALKALPLKSGNGEVRYGDSSVMTLASGAYVFCTDPPYFDNIGYADLSDFFYVWLRRALGAIYPDLFKTILVPKDDEIVADKSRHGGDKEAARQFFYQRLKTVFERMRNHSSRDYPVTIFYAFKQEERSAAGTSSTGWEGMLQALVDTGWMITGTWPIRTEHSNRPRGIGANALASSIVLVCRPRPDDAPDITRGEFRRLLRKEMPSAIDTLQTGNIAPVDMPQSCIGPGMSVFSRHRAVLEADGSGMSVRGALQLVHQVIDDVVGAEESEFDPDTRFAITWFETYGYGEGPYGQAENLSKAFNVSVAGVASAGILRSSAGKVRLYTRSELPSAWDPESDDRSTVWEATQHLIKRLDEEGERAAAALLSRLHATAQQTRSLTYRLYTSCERKGLSEEAQAYNGLVLAWQELEKMASDTRRDLESETQSGLFD